MFGLRTCEFSVGPGKTVFSLRTGQDIQDKVLEVESTGKAGGVLGTLTVSVLAAQAFTAIAS